ncbi:MAG: TRAP transporter large permease, partial [Clostridiales bacterium]|nr:TRAP transporter large permease [Clostridiales bacterium]
MDPILIGALGLVLMVVLILLRVHIGVAMGITGLVGFAIITDWNAALGLMQTVPYSTLSNYGMSVVIMFVLMGQLLSTSGLSKDLFDCAQKWFGHITGGLAISTVAACAMVGSLCGSNNATTATMGIVALPEMKKHNYDHGLAAATVACSSCLGAMVPPSILLTLYGISTSQSISKLFMAVIIPGLSLMLLFMISIYIRIKMKPSLGPAGEKYSWKERLSALWKIKDTVLVIALVMGGILGGFFTVNEAGAVGVIGVTLASIFRKKFNLDVLKNALLNTGKTVAMIFLIITGAMILGYFFTITQLPGAVAGALAGLPVHRNVILAVIVLIFIFLGAIMDELAMLLTTVPIFFPVMMALGFDPIWFGVMLVLVMTSGMICPPVGINVFIIAGIDKSIPMHKIYAGILPF